MRADEYDLLRRAYEAFNRRDVDAVLAVMQPDVEWANGLEGGTVQGHDAVRAYWIRQWGVIDPHVEPRSFTEDASGRVLVDVHQTVRDLQGHAVGDRMVCHAYTFEQGLVRRMQIIER